MSSGLKRGTPRGVPLALTSAMMRAGLLTGWRAGVTRTAGRSEPLHPSTRTMSSPMKKRSAAPSGVIPGGGSAT